MIKGEQSDELELFRDVETRVVHTPGNVIPSLTKVQGVLKYVRC